MPELSCLDDILFLELSMEIQQESMLSDISYLDILMESDISVLEGGSLYE